MAVAVPQIPCALAPEGRSKSSVPRVSALKEPVHSPIETLAAAE